MQDRIFEYSVVRQKSGFACIWSRNGLLKEEPAMKCEKIYLYDDDPKVTLTTYVLDDSPEMLKGKKRPAVPVCP